MSEDTRSRTKLYLDTYLANSNLTADDDWTEINFIVAYANPDYPIIRVYQEKAVDLVYTVGKPTSELKMGVRYTEHVPITIFTINRIGITGTKLAWKAEEELRRVCETYAHGSFRVSERIEDNETRLGSTVLYSTTFMLNYRRTAAGAHS